MISSFETTANQCQTEGGIALMHKYKLSGVPFAESRKTGVSSNISALFAHPIMTLNLQSICLTPFWYPPTEHPGWELRLYPAVSVLSLSAVHDAIMYLYPDSF